MNKSANVGGRDLVSSVICINVLKTTIKQKECKPTKKIPQFWWAGFGALGNMYKSTQNNNLTTNLQKSRPPNPDNDLGIVGGRDFGRWGM